MHPNLHSVDVPRIGLFASLLLFTTCALFAAPAEPTTVDIQSAEIDESSGLAASNRIPGHFWTHNDSGDDPRLFAINTQGVVTGSVELEGIKAIDWEDMASYLDGNVKRLLVADTGDNQSKRQSVMLYLLDEPDPREHVRTKSFQRIKVQYPDGPRDCEAIGVDIKRREIWWVAKSFLPFAQVYSMPLPESSSAPDRATLTHRGTLTVPMVSAMVIDPRSNEVLLVNYVQCLRYKVVEHAATGDWILQIPQVSTLPKLKQIEAVAVDADSEVWITSEGAPGKLSPSLG